MKDVSPASYTDHKNTEFFDTWADKYDTFRLSGWFRYTQQLSIQHFNIAPGAHILDVGCGTGSAVLYFASMADVDRACGIDISGKMLEIARQRLADSLKGKVEFVQSSSQSIPYGDNTFDHILCTNSFHHYADPLAALGEMKRVLKPGGELVIFENAPDLSLYTWAWDRLLRVFERGHVRYLPSKELGELIKEADFKDWQLRVLRNEFLTYGKLFASIQIWHAHA